MNSKDKDFLDSFFEYFNKYKSSGVRFLAVFVCFFILLVFSMFLAPFFVRLCAESFPFTINFLILSPLDILFNYFKIAFFFASILTFPFFVYQFGKLRADENSTNKRIDRAIYSLILAVIILFSTFLVHKILFPFLIAFLYGFNFSVAISSVTLSSIISAFIYTDFITIMLFALPLIRYLIKSQQFFNYAELTKYKKAFMTYAGVLTAIIALPLEILILAIIFLSFFGYYKILINFSKKRD